MWLLVKVLATIVFVNRYLGGLVMRLVRGDRWDEVDDSYEPTVTVVIPLFNEGRSIEETLNSVLATDYPRDKLRVVVVDDCSSDDSFELASALVPGA